MDDDDGLCDLDQLDQMINSLGVNTNRKVRTPPKRRNTTTTKSTTRFDDDDFDDLLVMDHHAKKEPEPVKSQKGTKCYPNAYCTPSGECGATRYGRVK